MHGTLNLSICFSTQVRRYFAGTRIASAEGCKGGNGY